MTLSVVSTRKTLFRDMQSESRVRRSARVDSDSFDSSESEYSESELEEEEEEEEEEDSDDESF